jgi:hypothetical protein
MTNYILRTVNRHDGYKTPIIDIHGDSNNLRFLDPSPVVVGLKFKHLTFNHEQNTARLLQ